MEPAFSRSRRSLLHRRFDFKSALGAVPCWWIICTVCAAILMGSERHNISPDGLSYLDLASGTLHNGPAHLISNYWSPGLPALITVAMLMFRPTPSQEFPLLHLVNFAIFLFLLWSFSFFIRCWTQSREEEMDRASTYRLLVPLAYCSFLWCTLTWISPVLITPDLGVAAFVFLDAGLALRLFSADAGVWHVLALGLTLGAGYYMKAALLPLGVVLIILLFLSLPFKDRITQRRQCLHLLCASVVFAIVAAPLAVAMSGRAHKPSIGEVGNLTYVWCVNHNWCGDLAGSEEWVRGTSGAYESLDHPARVLLQNPFTVEFATPVTGTYPLWDDPSYWYAGAKAHFNLRQQFSALTRGISVFKGLISEAMPLVAGPVALVLLGFHERPRKIARAVSWWLPAWSVAACSMFAFDLVESRYVAPFLLVLFLEVYRILLPRANKQIAAAVCATALLALMLPFGFDTAKRVAQMGESLIHNPSYQVAGMELQAMGLKSGDRVAIVGSGFGCCYFARYDRLRVAAQIPSEEDFWRADSAMPDVMVQKLAQIGVKAIVALNPPAWIDATRWKALNAPGPNRLAVLMLPGTVQNQ